MIVLCLDPFDLQSGGGGGAADGSDPSLIPDASIYHQGQNASEIGSRFGSGGSVENGIPRSGLRGPIGTGGGAGFYGYAQKALLPDGDDVTIPACGFYPFHWSRDVTGLSSLAGGR